MSRKLLLAVLGVIVLGIGLGVQNAAACGGFFCQTSPIDQNAERIIFVDNGDGTISTYIQIQFTGNAPDFSWILPLPTAITAEDLEVPEDAMAAFTELEIATNPVIIPPIFPNCAQRAREEAADGMVVMSAAVEVFATGEVGPFGFDVIGSEDPAALITWLRTNNYRVEEQMEPLINVYVEEKFVFLAMRLLPGTTDQDVEPIKVTYPSEKPMIPLRLTAVAANPNMAVLVWFYGSNQYVPENYAHVEIKNEDITFFTFGGHDYRAVMGRKADENNGQGFVTEFAGPTTQIAVTHPLLQELGQKHRYLTRLNTVISPEEMTVDPVFRYDPGRADVSNVRDLSSMTGLYDCERSGDNAFINLPFLSGSGGSDGSRGTTSYAMPLVVLISVCLMGVAGGGLVVFGALRLRRK
ncbi:MAG: DUF2330 domain-containing protein [Anaerolineae bacterium]|nr:DUF2330 domain-containing protein [Anaerolineae bacterium]